MSAVTLAQRAVAEHKQPHAPQGIAGYIAILCVLLFFLAVLALFSHVQIIIGTLASVETSDLTSYIALAESTDETYNDDGNLDSVSEDDIGLLGKPKNFAAGNGMTTSSRRPLTSSLRRTMSHLRTLNGFGKGFLRGLRHMLAVALVQIVVQCLLTSIIPRTINMAGRCALTTLAILIAIVIVAGPRVSVTHAIVSATPKSFFQRFPPVKTWKYIIGPACIASSCVMLVLGIPFLLNALNEKIFPTTMPSGEVDGKVEYSKPAIVAALVTNLVNLIFIISSYYYILVPMSISLVRIEASLLPAHDETIIPFDRTFGDRATPTGIDDRAVLSLKGAWRSVTAADRRRVAILMIKFMFIEFAVLMVGSMTVFGTLWVVSGGDIKSFFIGTLMRLQQ